MKINVYKNKSGKLFRENSVVLLKVSDSKYFSGVLKYKCDNDNTHNWWLKLRNKKKIFLMESAEIIDSQLELFA